MVPFDTLATGGQCATTAGWAQTSAAEPQAGDLTMLSLDQLMELKVTTTSRLPAPADPAAGSIVS
jgi:hypothetical protein